MSIGGIGGSICPDSPDTPEPSIGVDGPSGEFPGIDEPAGCAGELPGSATLMFPSDEPGGLPGETPGLPPGSATLMFPSDEPGGLPGGGGIDLPGLADPGVMKRIADEPARPPDSEGKLPPLLENPMGLPGDNPWLE